MSHISENGNPDNAESSATHKPIAPVTSELDAGLIDIPLIFANALAAIEGAAPVEKVAPVEKATPVAEAVPEPVVPLVVEATPVAPPPPDPIVEAPPKAAPPKAAPPDPIAPPPPDSVMEAVPAPPPIVSTTPQIEHYPDNPELSKEVQLALLTVKSGNHSGQSTRKDDLFTKLAATPRFDHLAPPKKSAGKIFLTTLILVFIIGSIGGGGFFYWWTNHAVFAYMLQPVVIIEGQTVHANDFLPENELTKGITADFKNPSFAPVPGPMTVPVTLKHGLRSLETNATLYVLTPENEITHEFRSEAPDLKPSDFVTNAQIVRGVPYELIFVEQPLPLRDYAVGEHPLRMTLNGAPFEATLIVVDTTPPSASPVDVVIEIGEELTPDDFVADIFDYSAIESVTFYENDQSETSIVAMQDRELYIEISDIHGNSTVLKASLDIIKNSSPPVFTGVENIIVGGRTVIESMAGSPVPFPEEIVAHDDFGRDVAIVIDDTTLDTNTVGEYTVMYIAEDFSGLRTDFEVQVYIIENDPEEVNAWVDAKLAEILTPEMTFERKMRAIWNAVRNTVSVTTSPDDEWGGSVYAAAHYAITNRRGDYYHFYALSEVMLTRAGVDNMRIVRSEDSAYPGEHFWNLVHDEESGWYHYDSMPATDWITMNSLQHMFTEKEASLIDEHIRMAFRRTSKGYYKYDAMLYPDVVEE